jgi:hypothetical protein
MLFGWGVVDAARLLEVAEQLWSVARASHPEWPDDAERARDLDAHRELAGRLRAAGAIGPR